MTSGWRVRSSPIPLQKVVDEVTTAVDQFRNSPYARVAKLNSAQFTFQVVETEKADVNVKPVILSFGISFSRDVTHSVAFIYDNRKPVKRRRVTGENETELTKEFAKLIKNAAEAAEKTIIAAGLPLQEVDLTVQFGVTWSGSGGVLAPVNLITLGGDVSASRNDVQCVKLSFTRK